MQKMKNTARLTALGADFVMLKTLYKDQGRLDRVGLTSSIQDKEHEGLAKKLQRMIKPGFLPRKRRGGSRGRSSVGGACAEISGRSATRSLHRSRLPAWHQVLPLADGKGASP